MSDNNTAPKTIEQLFNENTELSKAFKLNPDKPFPGVKFDRAGFGTVDIRTLTPAKVAQWNAAGKTLPYLLPKDQSSDTPTKPAPKP